MGNMAKLPPVVSRSTITWVWPLIFLKKVLWKLVCLIISNKWSMSFLLILTQTTKYPMPQLMIYLLQAPVIYWNKMTAYCSMPSWLKHYGRANVLDRTLERQLPHSVQEWSPPTKMIGGNYCDWWSSSMLRWKTNWFCQRMIYMW